MVVLYFPVSFEIRHGHVTGGLACEMLETGSFKTQCAVHYVTCVWKLLKKVLSSDPLGPTLGRVPS